MNSKEHRIFFVNHNYINTENANSIIKQNTPLKHNGVSMYKLHTHIKYKSFYKN